MTNVAYPEIRGIDTTGMSDAEVYREVQARADRICELNDRDAVAAHGAEMTERLERVAAACPDGFLLPGHQAWMENTEPEAS